MTPQSELPRDETGAAMDERLPGKTWFGRHKRALQYMGGVLLLSGASLLFVARFADSVDRQDLLIVSVRSGAIDSLVPARAQVVPIRSEVVEASDNARVIQVLVKDGELVKEGQTLARLSNPSLEADVQRYEAAALEQVSAVRNGQISLERLRSDLQGTLAQAEHSAQKARREHQKFAMLAKEGFVSQQMLSDAIAEERFATARFELAKSQWRATSNRLDNQSLQADLQATRLERAIRTNQKLLDALEIKAPLEGRVTGLTLLLGRQLQRGERIAQIDAAEGVKLVAMIDQHYLPRITEGQEARVVMHYGPVTAKVIRVLPQVSQGRFQVEIELQDPSQATPLQRGQQVEVEVFAALPDDRRSLFIEQGPFLAEAMETRQLYRLSKDGSAAELISVKFGRRSNRGVEVLSGVAEGDKVIASSYGQFGQRKTLHLSSRAN